MAETPKQEVIETLQLLASKSEQLEYGRRVPIADVSAELFCFWNDAFWHGDAKLRTEFSEHEWAALIKFHSIFERVCKLLPLHESLPPIEEFVNTPLWLQLSRAAERALQVLISAHDDVA